MGLPCHVIRRDTMKGAVRLKDLDMKGADHVHPGNLTLMQGQAITIGSRGKDDVMQGITKILAMLKIKEPGAENS